MEHILDTKPDLYKYCTGELEQPEREVSNIHYLDTGCEVIDSCFKCPLPVCKDDDKDWYKRYKGLAKYANIIMSLHNDSKTPQVLADENNITVRTVFRLKKQLREGTINLETLHQFANFSGKRVKHVI